VVESQGSGREAERIEGRRQGGSGRRAGEMGRGGRWRIQACVVWGLNSPHEGRKKGGERKEIWKRGCWWWELLAIEETAWKPDRTKSHSTSPHEKQSSDCAVQILDVVGTVGTLRTPKAPAAAGCIMVSTSASSEDSVMAFPSPPATCSHSQRARRRECQINEVQAWRRSKRRGETCR
jgi:hypothetical protein